jgi:2-iminobutanoate/2-iminopropanoate deaminase
MSIVKAKEIKVKSAPPAAGPYSQAVAFGKLVFCSGQIGLDPKTGTLLNQDIQTETEQAFNNLSAVLASAKTDFGKVLKVEVFLTDMNDFAKMNAVYTKYFPRGVKPVRTTVEVSKLPKNARIEIACIAYLK